MLSLLDNFEQVTVAAPAVVPGRPSTDNTGKLVDNGDGTLDISDAVATLGYLFLGKPPHVLGRDCVPIEDCPDHCTP